MLTIRCPSCGSSYGVKDELQGRRLKCRGCGGPVVAQDVPTGSSNRAIVPTAAAPTTDDGRLAGYGAQATDDTFDDFGAMVAGAPLSSGWASTRGWWGALIARIHPRSNQGAIRNALIVGGVALGVTVAGLSVRWILGRAGAGGPLGGGAGGQDVSANPRTGDPEITAELV